MRKLLISASAAFSLAMLPGSAGAQEIPGVKNEETKIRSGQILDVYRGQGDAVYVRDRDNRWFRLGLNDGCLDRGRILTPFAVSKLMGSSGSIRRGDQVSLGGQRCVIVSIRRSVAPPQVDSNSPIPVD